MNEKVFWDVAHRGGEGYAPENTLIAFKRTIEYDIAWIETDVRISKDGHLILIHDKLLDRTTNGSGDIHDYTLEELNKLDAGSWFGAEFEGEKIPTLEELFEHCGDELHYLLEIKDPGLNEEDLVKSIHNSGLREQIYVIGSNPEALEKVKSINSEMNVGFTCHIPTEENIERALAMHAHHIIVRNERLTLELIESCSKRGLEVLSTTVRTDEELERAVHCNVLGMPLPDPRRLHEYLNKQ